MNKPKFGILGPMKKKNIMYIAAAVVLILLIPLIAMQFTSEVQWSPADFVTVGILLFCIGLAYEFVRSRNNSVTYQMAAAGTLFTSLLIIWLTLAVGIIGSEDNPMNGLYLVVLGIVLLGANLSHLKAKGLSYTLFTAAVAQMLVPTIAFFVAPYDFNPGVPHVFALNAVFALMWLGSGLLFRKSASSSAVQSGKLAK